MGFFDPFQNQTEDSGQLNKALEAGYGTDSANFTGGRALIPENCEQETLNALSKSKDDCKIMASIKTQKVGSTVHEKNIRTGVGDYRFLNVSEGEEANEESNQTIGRKTFDMKYIQTERGITKQMIDSETFEGAYASEKLAGIDLVIQACEYNCLHGDSRVVPEQFDSFETQIRRAPAEEQNIKDLRGVSIGTYGEKLFDEIAGEVYQKGGYLDKTLFPSILAKDIKDLFADRIRFFVSDRTGSMQQLPDYPTATGATIRFTGDGAGTDKFYDVKGTVAAAGNATKRPAAPASVTASAAANSSSKFASGDAGDYIYTVHAINKYGISAGTQIAAAVAVAAGNGVTLTINPGSGVAPTGYIICRSAKDGTVVMEMTRIAANPTTATTFVDLNEELPGTASMLFLTENKLQSIYKFGQLTPVSTLPLGRMGAKERFLVLTYGALELYVPKYCGLIKNIGYNGGLY